MNDASFFPLIDSHDHDILMHKEVHFGGSFLVMLDYYKNGGKGAQDSFELDRIEELHQMEEKSHQNLSDLLLTEEEKEKVAKAKTQYHTLKNLYSQPKDSIALKVADLILSEDFEAKKEVEAICKMKGASVPVLIEILNQDEFYDPLFPGYGWAPGLAAKCLGILKTPEAVIPLFQALSKADFFIEEAILNALFCIGAPSKDFLLTVVCKKPLSRDNENAAISLLHFKEDPDVSKTCLKLLQDPDVLLKPILATYLLIGCDSLTDPLDRNILLTLLQKPDLSAQLKQEIKVVVNQWKTI